MTAASPSSYILLPSLRRESRPTRSRLLGEGIGRSSPLWSVLKDLNLRPPAPNAGALPDCAKHGKECRSVPGCQPVTSARAASTSVACEAKHTRQTNNVGLFPAVNSVRRFKPDAEAEREQNLGAKRYLGEMFSAFLSRGEATLQPAISGVSAFHAAPGDTQNAIGL